MMVHEDEATLKKHSDNTAGTGYLSELPIESVRRLCCEASVVPVVKSADGEPLNVGRKTRTVSTAIRRALWTRDKGCAFPGCSHTRFIDAHHIEHWADGGETNVDNMVLLCSQHHRMVHEGGYSIVKHAAGLQGSGFMFKRPDEMAVPDCGYRIDDWLDEDLDAGLPNVGNSAEVFTAI